MTTRTHAQETNGPRQNVNLAADSYGIAQATGRCWRCRERIDLYGLVIPGGHRVRDRDETGTHWRTVDHPAILKDVQWVADPVVARLRQHTRNYMPRFAGTAGVRYWVNHCANCTSMQEDDGRLEGVERPVCPVATRAAKAIELLEIREPFEAAAVPIYGGDEAIAFAMKHLVLPAADDVSGRIP